MTEIAYYVDRNETIQKFIKRKNVLHIGCIGFADSCVDEKVAQAQNSLHATITKHSADALGIDNDCKTISELKQAGVFDNIICGDAERLGDVEVLENRKFDVIVAGDIIEHLSNPGLMLDGVRSLIGENGLFVVSTPNSFGLSAWVRFYSTVSRKGSNMFCASMQLN